MFNCTKPPFNDVRVRQAVAWAIDRQEIVDLVWYGTAVPATEATAKPSPWYTGVDPYKGGPDLDKAKALLREAGITGRLRSTSPASRRSRRRCARRRSCRRS